LGLTLPLPHPVIEDQQVQQNFEAIARADAFAIDRWHLIGATGEPAFVNSWTNFNASPDHAARFCRIGGFTVLAGIIKGGTSSVRAFDLPAGLRPDGLYCAPASGQGPRYVVAASGGAAVVDIYGLVSAAPANAGAVVPIDLPGSAVATACYLDGVTFRHE
jgi:hypothetical protein